MKAGIAVETGLRACVSGRRLEVSTALTILVPGSLAVILLFGPDPCSSMMRVILPAESMQAPVTEAVQEQSVCLRDSSQAIREPPPLAPMTH